MLKEELTLEITKYCEHDCFYCSTNASVKGKHIPFEAVKDFLKRYDKFAEKAFCFKRINISGGEPLSHPDFYKIHKLCEKYSSNIWVYSNVIKNLIFNGNLLNEVRVESSVILLPGSKIPKADKIHFLRPTPSGMLKDKDFPKMEASFSGEICNDSSHIVLQADALLVPVHRKKNYKGCKCED